MSYTVRELRTLLQDQIAPGSAKEFLRLLNEADARLLQKGKWRWCREVVELTPVDGILTLPNTYSSILAALFDRNPKSIHPLDYEFTAGGVSVDGAKSYNLHDLGVSITVTEKILLDVVSAPGHQDDWDPAYGLKSRMVPGPLVNESPSWGTEGVDPLNLPPGKIWGLSFDPDNNEWTLVVIIDSAIWQTWVANMAGLDSETQPWEINPNLWLAQIDPGPTGLPMLEATTSSTMTQSRRYKVEGGENLDEPIECLVGKAPRTFDSDDDVPHCISLAGLKLAMYAISYEESNNLAKAREYWAEAVLALNDENHNLIGGAKEMMPNRPGKKSPALPARSNFM